MLYTKRQQAKGEVFEASNAASVLFLGATAFVMLVTANGIIGCGIWALSATQKIDLTMDAVANLALLGVAMLGALLIDAQSLLDMFGRLRLSSKDGQESSNPLVTLYSLGEWERTVQIVLLACNWLSAHGLICSGLKCGMEKPLALNNVKMGPDTLHDLWSGDLLLNPLIRAWNWESVYGMVCGLHLGTYFAVSVAHRARFNMQKLLPVAIGYFAFGLFLMAIAGFFRSKHYCTGWMGPSEGFWLVFMHVSMLYLVFEQWQKIQPTQTVEEAGPEFLEGIHAFADKWRGWKPVSVFALTTFLSLVFAYATPVYPIVMGLTYIFYWKSHPMDRGYNKVLLVLTIVHQVLHYFVHSYRTLEDQPLLFIDKFTHFLFAVVAAQQFRENRELLSRDPLVKLFNYITIFVWIPGDLIAMYISGLYGPSDFYLKHMIAWGGYCLSTGTAMAYVNNDVMEDNAPNSSRRFIVAQQGKITGHGIQIAQALFFAILYIVSTGGSASWANKIEYVYDYASHLYTGYGAM